ncbi:hypothetical protein [Exiguobacterium antarcticum]|uniref:hypothetical protein n=1 Tax=Exiguobacterium antarcticum TaxID=132920 RepID=UPI000285ECC1|nr:hypothetical protein [Exiguobacterium antarcticum]AFS71668.1 TSP type-3 repeat domain-containing protein [Exiguobacterium antarcticum B7]
MKKMNYVVTAGLACTLMLTPLGSIDAKSKTSKYDRNKNGIHDSWEKKYKLKGKKLAQQDTDHDGLSNYTEYKLELSPRNQDSDRDRISDANEDTDRDGLSNTIELELGTKPYTRDSDRDGILDGKERNQDGHRYEDMLKKMKIKLATETTESQIEYHFKKKKSQLRVKTNDATVDEARVRQLIQFIESNPKMTEEELRAQLISLFALSGSYQLKIELEYFNRAETKSEHRHVDEDDQDTDQDDQGQDEDEDDDDHDQDDDEDENEEDDD